MQMSVHAWLVFEIELLASTSLQHLCHHRLVAQVMGAWAVKKLGARWILRFWGSARAGKTYDVLSGGLDVERGSFEGRFLG